MTVNASIALWHAEHHDFMRLLDLLQQEVVAFQAGARPNYDLMREIVEYLTHYPDRLHHAREGVAFRCLARRDPTFGPLVARLEQEHRVIAHAGQALARRLTDAEGDAMMPRTELEMAAATYLVYYRLHIDKEEEDVLPRAESLLTPEDWAEVAAAVASESDPVFGGEAGSRFRELRRVIAREPSTHLPA